MAPNWREARGGGQGGVAGGGAGAPGAGGGGSGGRRGAAGRGPGGGLRRRGGGCRARRRNASQPAALRGDAVQLRVALEGAHPRRARRRATASPPRLEPLAAVGVQRDHRVRPSARGGSLLPAPARAAGRGGGGRGAGDAAGRRPPGKREARGAQATLALSPSGGGAAFSRQPRRVGVKRLREKSARSGSRSRVPPPPARAPGVKPACNRSSPIALRTRRRAARRGAAVANRGPVSQRRRRRGALPNASATFCHPGETPPGQALPPSRASSARPARTAPARRRTRRR